MNSCLRRILKIRWPDTISNVQLWQKMGQLAADEEIRKRRWGWIGHTLRRPPTNITRQALRWNPQGKRKRGRPRSTWRRNLEAETTKMGYTWSQVEKMAQDRGFWRALVGGPYPSRGDGQWWWWIFYFKKISSYRNTVKGFENICIHFSKIKK